MLVLTRTVGEELIIGDDIRVRVSEIKGGRIKLAIEAPKHISIQRQEAALRQALGEMATASDGTSTPFALSHAQ